MHKSVNDSHHNKLYQLVDVVIIFVQMDMLITSTFINYNLHWKCIEAET